MSLVAQVDFMSELRSREERDRIVEQWIHLPKRVATDLWWLPDIRKLGMEDAIGYGNVALVQAAEKWDESRGFKFVTYAYRCIWNCLLRMAKTKPWIARLPRNTSKKWKDNVKLIKRCQFRPHISTIDRRTAQAEHIDDCDDRDTVEAALKKIAPTLAYIVKQHYMSDLPLTVIGDLLQCSRHEASVLKKDALVKLRNWLADQTEI